MPRRCRMKWILLMFLVLCVVSTVVVFMQLSVLANVSQHLTREKKSNLRPTKDVFQTKFEYTLSMIVATDLSQLNKLNFIVNSWLSDISVGLCVFSYESDDAHVIIRDFSFPSRVHIFEYNQKGNSFPINSLRNLAIQNTNSSHLYIADVDIIPATNLREVFLSLPSSFLRDSRHAFIVPLFDTPFQSFTCNRWFDCVNTVRQYTSLSKKELVWCIRFNGCRNLGEKDVNKYLPALWESLPTSNYTLPLSCWDNPFQEPYSLPSHHAYKNLPSFDESFVDYGYNRVQWISLLHYSGYRFSILSQTWSFHVKHSPSTYEKLSKEKSDPTKGKKGGVNTRRMFDNVIKKYEKELGKAHLLPACQLPVNEVVKEETIESNKYGKKTTKRRLIRRPK